VATLAKATLAPTRRARPAPPSPPRLDIVIPVHNEERALCDNVSRLHRCLVVEFDVPFRVTIADSASSGNTAEIARSLVRDLPCVRHLPIGQQGHGRALRAAWSASEAAVVAYMDVNLSTDLAHLPGLLEPLLAGRADIVIGSRLAPGAQATRGLRRGLISRSYNALLGIVLDAGFSDARCGFKAARREVVHALLPLIENDGWFFDTELLYLAQRNAYSIREIPVCWTDDTDSRAGVARTAIEALKGIARLRRRTRDGRDQIDPLGSAVRVRGASEAGVLSVGAPDHPRPGCATPARSGGCGSRRTDQRPTARAIP